MNPSHGLWVVPDEDSLRSRYQRLADAELLRVVESQPDEYRPEAIAVAIEVLSERGIAAEAPALESDLEKLQRAEATKEDGHQMMLTGLAVMTMGIGIALVPDATGGRIRILGWSALLFGGLMLWRGLIRRERAEALENEVRRVDSERRERAAGHLSAPLRELRPQGESRTSARSVDRGLPGG